jgi:hypothetical protein
VTPALSAIHDELLSRASTAPFEEKARALRESFLRRTSGVPSLGSPVPETRVLAAWDDALTSGGLAAELAPGFQDAAERALVRVLVRAHRGLFRLERVGRQLLANDVISGASFILLPRDDMARGAGASNEDTPLFEARVVAATDGCATLPGVIFHPPDATALIDRIVRVARDRGISREHLCDALLRMEHTFANLSRVKISYAYKVEALETPSAGSVEPEAPDGSQARTQD